MIEDGPARPLFRLFAALMALCALPVTAIGVWFLLAGSFDIALMALAAGTTTGSVFYYVARTGTIPE